MHAHKRIFIFSNLTILLLLMTACQQPGGESDVALDIAIAVSMTQTAAAQDVQQPVVEPTSTPTEITIEMQPLNPDECIRLAGTLEQNLGISGQLLETNFEDHINQKTGVGCQAIFTTTGLEVENIGVLEIPAKAALENLGWQEDPQYAGGGAGGLVYGYRKDNGLCHMLISTEPSDQALCSADEPISTCWERLTPEQKVFTVDLNCAHGDLPEFVLPIQVIESELQRIEFGAGEFSKEISQRLTPGGIDHFVISAGAEQEFDTTIYPPGVATVTVYGADGIVLKSDLNNVSSWSGVFPSTQDYFIDITSIVQIETEYTFSIGIPPLTPIATTGQIAGSIVYLSETNPPLHVVAYNLESSLWYFLKTGENTFYYEIPGLPPGTYHIVAYSQENMASGHLTPITVVAGTTTENINFMEWLAADSAPFAPDPIGW